MALRILNETDLQEDKLAAVNRQCHLTDRLEKNLKVSKNWSAFLDRGGISTILNWLMNFKSKVEFDRHMNITKLYAGFVAHILTYGMEMPEVPQKLVSAGFFEKLLSLIFTKPLLLNDTEFTEDFYFWGILLTLASATNDNVSSMAQQVPEIVLGSNFSAIEDNFKTKNISLIKLMLGALYLQRNLTKASKDFDLLSMSFQDILDMRDLVFYDLVQTDQWLIRRSKSSFWRAQNYTINPAAAQNWLNFFLLAQSNRRHLCDRQSFDYFFYGVDYFTKLNYGALTENLIKHCIISLRTMKLMMHTCSKFLDYLKEDKIDRK